MECEAARELYVEALGGRQPVPAEVDRHTAGCDACRAEVTRLGAAWAAVAALPVLDPPPGVARAIRRRIRWEAAREVLASVEGWQRGALVGVAGFVASVVLSLLVPYDTMVTLCRWLVPDAVPAPAAYLLAGLMYGLLPMLVAAMLERRATGVSRVVGGLEALVVFAVVLTPYVLLRCGDFPVTLLGGFLAGIALGAITGEAAGLRLRRRRAFA